MSICRRAIRLASRGGPHVRDRLSKALKGEIPMRFMMMMKADKNYEASPQPGTHGGDRQAHRRHDRVWRARANRRASAELERRPNPRFARSVDGDRRALSGDEGGD